MEIHLKKIIPFYGDKYNTNFSTSINLGIKVPKNKQLLFFCKHMPIETSRKPELSTYFIS